MKSLVFSTVLFSMILLRSVHADDFVPLALDYQAQTYAYAYACSPAGLPDSQTYNNSSSNSPCLSDAWAHSSYYEGGPGVDDYEEWAESRCETLTDGVENLGTIMLTSKINGWGRWGWDYYPSEGQSTHYQANGGGTGNGYASLQGTVTVGQFPGYPPGSSGMVLQITAQVNGNNSADWISHNWWLKIWTEDYNAPIAVIDQNNLSAEISIESGDTFNIKLYQTGQEDEWPESGLSTTINVQFKLLVPNIADMSGDGLINFADYAFLAKQWQKAPNLPSADISSLGGDRVVNIMDLWWLAEMWLQNVPAAVYPAWQPNPTNASMIYSNNAILGWRAGYGTFSHDVYFGTNFNEVNEANIASSGVYMGNQDANHWDANNYAPAGLDFDTTYYWRIDERGKYDTTKGQVWRFLTLGDTNLVAWWKLDEISGTIAFDSALENDGNLVNGPLWTSGKINGGLSFDANNDYVDVNDNASLSFGVNDRFSISFWAKPSSNGEVISKMRTGGRKYSFGYEVRWDGANQRFLFVIESSNYYSVAISTPTGSAPTGNWSHVICVYDNRNMKIYLNGQLAATGYANIGYPTSTPDKNLTIGARSVDAIIDSYFGGTIDDVRIYNKAL